MDWSGQNGVAGQGYPDVPPAVEDQYFLQFPYEENWSYRNPQNRLHPGNDSSTKESPSHLTPRSSPVPAIWAEEQDMNCTQTTEFGLEAGDKARQ